jgi:hypothetical protein
LAQIADRLMREQAATKAAPAEKPREGLGAAFGRGAESLASAIRTGVKGVYAPEEAAAEARTRSEDIGKRYAEQVSLEKVKEAYRERGLLPAAGEALSQVPAALAEQAPNIGLMLAGSRAGAMAGAPFGLPGIIAGGVVGGVAPIYLQAAGSDVQRQAEEAIARGEKPEINRLAAYGTAVPQAALEYVSTMIPLGRTLAGKALGPAVEKALASGSTKAAEKLAKESLAKSIVKGTAVGALAEIPTEIAQQMLERAQAGLSITSDDALKEYGEAAYQAGLLAPIGAAGRVAERGAARTQQELRAQEEQAKQTEARRAQEAATAAAAEAEKQTPEYALRFATDHEALQKEYDDLGALLKKKLPPGSSFADKQTFEDQKKRRNELAAQLKEQAKEYNRVKSLLPPELTDEQKRTAALSPLEYQMEQAGTAPVTVTPSSLRMPTPGTMFAPQAPRVFTGEEDTSPAALAAEYAQSRINLANEQAYVDSREDSERPAFYVAYLMQDPAMAKALVEADKPIPGLKKRESNAVLGALKLQLEAIEAQKTADETARQEQAAARTAQQEQARLAFEASTAPQQDVAGFQRSMGDVVPRPEFALPKEAENLIDRMMAATEPAQQNRVMASLTQQLSMAPATMRYDRATALLRDVQEKAKTAEGDEKVRLERRADQLERAQAAMGKEVNRRLFDITADLGEQGLVPRNVLKPTGEARRAKGEFRLFGEAEPAAREVTREDLQERLTRAMASNKLSDEAYEFLSRMERSLPEKDREVAELEQVPGAFKPGVTYTTGATTPGYVIAKSGKEAKISYPARLEDGSDVTVEITRPVDAQRNVVQQINPKQKIFRAISDVRVRQNGALLPVDLSGLVAQTDEQILKMLVDKGAIANVTRPKKITPEGEAAAPTRSLFRLLDEQLRRIESGEEGMARPGAGRKTTLQAFPAEGRADVAGAERATAEDIIKQALYQQKVNAGMKPEQARAEAFADFEEGRIPDDVRRAAQARAAVTKRPARDFTPTRFEGEQLVPGTLRGPSAKALPLSLQAELEPFVEQAERGREGEMEQMALFPSEQKKVAVTRATPEEFQQYLGGAAAERLRKQFEPETKKLARARTRLDELNKQIDELNGVVAEIEQAQELAFPAKKLEAARRELSILEERPKPISPVSLGEPGIDARIEALRDYIATAEAQEAKLNSARARIKDGEIRSLKEELAAVKKDFGSVLEAVSRRALLRAAVVELQVPIKQAESFVDNFNISGTDKELLKEQLRLKEGETTVGKHVKELNAQISAIDKALDRVDAVARVVDAEQRVRQYESRSIPPEAPDAELLAQAKQALNTARAEVARLTKEVGAIEGRTAAQEAVARRIQAARNRAEEELKRTEKYRTRQAALERQQKAPEGVDQFGQPLRSMAYDPITDAQRAARKDDTPTILADEMRQVRGNPLQVLKGYRSRITAITKELQKAYDTARRQTVEGIKERGPYEAALAAYRSTVVSESPELRAIETERRERIDAANKEITDPAARAQEYDRINEEFNRRRDELPRSKNVGRANMEPRLAQLEKAYNDAVTNALNARVMPKGLVGYQEALSEMLRREAWLKGLIDRGEVEVAAPPKPRKRKTEAELKEIQDVLNQKEIAEAAARDGAPKLDITATTKSEIDKERKAKGTLYSSKGVGQETTLTEKAKTKKEVARLKLRQKPTAEEKARLEELTIIQQALDKQERKEPLTELEQMLLTDYRRSRKPTKESEVERQRREEEGEEELTSEELAEKALEQERAEFDAEEVADTGILKTGTEDLDALFDKPDTLQQLAATASQGPALKEEVDSEKSAAVVMSNIAESTTNDLTRAVADRLKLLLGNTRVEIVKDLRDPDGQAAYGQAAADGSFIRLDAKYGLNERTAVHEGVHAATERVIQMPEDQLTDDQRRAKRELEELFEAYKKLPGATNANAKTSLSEFASEALSDDVMQVEMRQQKWTLRHMWDSFKSALLRMLGIKTPENMLDATLAAVDNLMTKVPRPTQADNALLGPKLLNQPRNLNPEFAEADAIARKVVAKDLTFTQKVRAVGSGLAMETSLVDRFAGFERLSKYMDKLKGSQMMFYLRMYDQRMNFTAQSAANGALELREVKRRDGEREFLVESKAGANLQQVVKMLKDAAKIIGNVDSTSRLFSMYLIAQRADRVGFDKVDLRGQTTEAEIRQVADRVNNNAELKRIFNNARDIYNEYNENLVRFAQQTGVFSKKDADSLLRAKDYVPFYRERNGVVQMTIGGETPITVGNIKDMPHLAELVGGDTKIIDFMVSSVQNTNMLVDMSLRNLATRNAMIELVNLGAAKITPKPTDGTNVVKFKYEGQDRYAILDTEQIEVNGKKIDTGVPADLLVKGMEGIPLQTTGIMRLMTVPTQLLRRAITLNPLYMVRQLMRDSLSASIASGADIIPVYSALKEIGSAAKGTLERRGITGGQVFTGTQEDLSKIMRQVADPNKSGYQVLGKLEWLGMEADALTRRAQYNSYIKQGMSEMEATLLSLESMNFNKRGASPSIHMANSLIPFFNAQIQGLNVLYKALFGQITAGEKARIKQKLLTRGAMMFAASLAYAHAMQDDEAYKNALPSEKYGNWFFRLPFVDEPLRIPIPFEIGYIFKALPEALYNTLMTERGGEQAKEAMLGILRNTIPGGSSYFIPQTMKPAIEVLTNYSLFTERPLVSGKEQALLPEYQYRNSTTEAAKLFGGVTGFSPIKLEALVSGYFSTMGMALLQLASLPIPKGDTPEKATKRLSEMPVVGSAFQPNDARWIINSTYDALDDARKVQASYKELVNRGEKAEARALLDARANDYARAEMAGYYRQQMGLLNQYRAAINASSKSPQEKRELLDKVRQAEIRLSSMVRDASDAAKLRVV